MLRIQQSQQSKTRLNYPEAAPYIRRAVEAHGVEWVLEHYYDRLYHPGRLMAMPNKEELSFYDEEKDDGMSKEERVEMYQSLAEYRDDLRTGTKPEK